MRVIDKSLHKLCFIRIGFEAVAHIVTTPLSNLAGGAFARKKLVFMLIVLKSLMNSLGDSPY